MVTTSQKEHMFEAEFHKNLIHSDVGPMHGLFDHEPVFSVVVQIIFQTEWASNN